jgi:mRNA-decapping enzyme subunit 2
LAVPTYGAILLDPSLQFCLLVQGYWVKASWGFPKGKVNQDEPPMECAIREVLEETGFDIRNMVKADDYLEYKRTDQLSRLYIVCGVPKDTKFLARTRNEIKSFEWFRVEHLPSFKGDVACKLNTGLSPNAFFMVIPFVKKLRLWISHKLGATVDSVEPMSVQQHTEIVSRPTTDGSLPTNRPMTTKSRPATTVRETETKQRTAPRDSNQCRDNRLEPVSPRRPPSQKQLQILKRPDVKTTKPEKQNQVESDVVPSRVEITQPFVCHAWINFRLDVNAVLTAMFPSHDAPPPNSALT